MDLQQHYGTIIITTRIIYCLWFENVNNQLNPITHRSQLDIDNRSQSAVIDI